jgi:hypothetical protein
MMTQRVTGATSPDSLSSKIISSGGDTTKGFHSLEPDLRTALDRQLLANSRHDHFAPSNYPEAGELEVLGEKHQVLVRG